MQSNSTLMINSSEKNLRAVKRTRKLMTIPNRKFSLISSKKGFMRKKYLQLLHLKNPFQNLILKIHSVLWMSK